MTKRPKGKLLFKVALVSDTHVNESEDTSASPYSANAEANPRARYVFSQINQSDPALVIHLGDMVNPVPELPSYPAAVANFHSLVAELRAPLHLMPGNHDIGDKPVSWMPAGMVEKHSIAQYRAHFGADYHSFDHAGCHFVIINAPLINSGDPAEAEQRTWLQADLAAHTSSRTFMFTHYPMYVSDSAEPESYDNIDEPGRSWLLGLIAKYRPEAVFAAHVHNFWYDRIGPTEYYVVPSTCFVRHDYSEMYRIDGGDQKGRNDSAKLGHLTLEIYERGHVAHYHRSYGANLTSGEAPPVAVRPHTKTSSLVNLSIDMRHAWAEEMVVAPSGAVDEFRRKRARNDYPVMALWEMGLRGMRVPLQDLEDARTRRRMEIMADVGHHFQVYCCGLPNAGEQARLAEHKSLVAKLELVVNWEQIGTLRSHLQAIRDAIGLPLVLSRVNRKDRAKHAGGRFNHLISHGFTLDETAEVAEFLVEHAGMLAGVQFSIPRSVEPWTAAATLSAFAQKCGSAPHLYVKSTEASPAQMFEDDTQNALRFAHAAMAAAGHGIPVIIDTFDDVDRGYFTRTGLVDRRFNPRLAGQVMSTLVHALEGETWRAADGPTPALVNSKGQLLSVVLGAPPRGAVALDPTTGCPASAGALGPQSISVVLTSPGDCGAGT
ncbi:MAG: metallophosphoesterase [Hyphomicrobiaceae bacterium]